MDTRLRDLKRQRFLVYPYPLARGPVREFHVSRAARERYELDASLFSFRGNLVVADLPSAQQLAHTINAKRDVARNPHLAVQAGDLYAAGLIDEVLHLMIAIYEEHNPGFMARSYEQLRERLGEDALGATLRRFVETFPGSDVYRGEISADEYLADSTDGVPHTHVVLEELLILKLTNENPALERFQEFFDDDALEKETAYLQIVEGLEAIAADEPGFGSKDVPLLDLLRTPFRNHPTSLEGQLGYMRQSWRDLGGERFDHFVDRILRTVDTLKEERKPRGFGGPGPSEVPDIAALRGDDMGREAPEAERFSPDRSWMPRVVMIAKSSYVWLDQLSKIYERDITRLDQIPGEELDKLADWGFTGLWLIGLWERSEASRRIKHLRGNPDAVASAYSLYDYDISADLGGTEAYENLRDRAWQRGIRLASDMVPNHMGIDSRWVIEHPDWFLSLDHSPYPGYTFEGPDLSPDERVTIQLEDHYYDATDAAVVFKRTDNQTGDARYIYHGNDGTTMPWNDTAQLNYLDDRVREGVIQTILHVARQFPIIRFDAAMTLAKRHIQRLWFPEPGSGGAIPSRSHYGSMTNEAFEREIPEEFWREVVDRVAEEVPDTLLLAEAFWMMEGYFVRTLGMHRVYNSAFMNMLKREENSGYRELIKNVLAFDPEILKRYVNFMNNPDEETAVAQFGKDDKYFGTCILMTTMPGLPMFGHGQVEGFTEKYGMEYRRPKYDERPDDWLVDRHRREIFPLLHRRAEFAEVDNFRFYDVTRDGDVLEDVYAYSNRYGDKASLIVYNNSVGEAHGWLKTSAPYVVKTDGDKAEHREDVASALGLRGGERDFTVVRDSVAGLEYLYESRTLHSDGVRVDLGAFKYRVLLDIREVHDDDQDSYRQLYDQLGGQGVASIDDALADLRFRPLHEALQALLTPRVLERVAATASSGASGTVSGDAPERDDLQARYASFLETAQSFSDFGAETRPVSAAFTRELAVLRELPSLAATDLPSALETAFTRELKEKRTLGTPTTAVLFGWLVLHRIGALRADGPLEQTSYTAIRDWRLDRALRLAFRELSDSQAEVEHSVLLTQLLVRYQSWYDLGDDPDDDLALLSEALLRYLLADADVLRFLQVNAHEGVMWFNQEAFRDLVGGLELTATLSLLAEHRADPTTPVAVPLTRAREIILDLEAAEAASGYRVDQLLPTDEATLTPTTEDALEDAADSREAAAAATTATGDMSEDDTPEDNTSEETDSVPGAEREDTVSESS
ncbi:MAG: alpha-amylase family glycosyl hydrolase [Trueperaceae bacterium]|nr:alpha-amylase family glycosyl hydrolase [Trueperaceae bacterium]